jgi:uncharacterized protein
LTYGGARVQDLIISVADILNRPGIYRDVRLERPFHGIATALAALDDRPLRAELRLEAVVEGILVTGPVTAEAALECARCLKGFVGDVDVEVCELYAAPGHEPEDDDAYRVRGTDIDLEPMLRDAIALALPLNPLCRESCAGLCSRCGRDLNQGPCDCSDDKSDPRWAVLDALRDRLSTS